MSLIPKRGQPVLYYLEESGEPCHAIVASYDHANTEDNSAPRLHIAVLLPGLAKWSSRHSVLMYKGQDQESKKGKWAPVTLLD